MSVIENTSICEWRERTKVRISTEPWLPQHLYILIGYSDRFESVFMNLKHLKHLKIFSLNCWLLPFPISVHNHNRLMRIIFLIRHHHPDIIALQEVWLKRYVKLIEKELPEYYFIKSDSGIYNKSGLVTGLLKKYQSSCKFSKIHFFPIIKNYSLSEKLARKGYHIMKFYPDIFMINTHLYAPQNASHEHIVKSQFRLLEKFSKSKKCIIAGDLNLKEENMMKLNTVYCLDPSDLTASNINPYFNILFNRPIIASKRIDYILKTRNSRLHLSTRCLNSPIVSDHRVLLCDIKV
jgi:endonuclease/exonuclease/phosphatase family metal-dependent hydrolase